MSSAPKGLNGLINNFINAEKESELKSTLQLINDNIEANEIFFQDNIPALLGLYYDDISYKILTYLNDNEPSQEFRTEIEKIQRSIVKYVYLDHLLSVHLCESDFLDSLSEIKRLYLNECDNEDSCQCIPVNDSPAILNESKLSFLLEDLWAANSNLDIKWLIYLAKFYSKFFRILVFRIETFEYHGFLLSTLTHLIVDIALAALDGRKYPAKLFLNYRELEIAKIKQRDGFPPPVVVFSPNGMKEVFVAAYHIFYSEWLNVPSLNIKNSSNVLVKVSDGLNELFSLFGENSRSFHDVWTDFVCKKYWKKVPSFMPTKKQLIETILGENYEEATMAVEMLANILEEEEKLLLSGVNKFSNVEGKKKKGFVEDKLVKNAHGTNLFDVRSNKERSATFTSNSLYRFLIDESSEQTISVGSRDEKSSSSELLHDYYLGWDSIISFVGKLVSTLFRTGMDISLIYPHLKEPSRVFFSKLLFFLNTLFQRSSSAKEIFLKLIRARSLLSKSNTYEPFLEFLRLNNFNIVSNTLLLLSRIMKNNQNKIDYFLSRGLVVIVRPYFVVPSKSNIHIVERLHKLLFFRICSFRNSKLVVNNPKHRSLINTLWNICFKAKEGLRHLESRRWTSLGFTPLNPILQLKDKLNLHFLIYFGTKHPNRFLKIIEPRFRQTVNDYNVIELTIMLASWMYNKISKSMSRQGTMEWFWCSNYGIEEFYCLFFETYDVLWSKFGFVRSDGMEKCLNYLKNFVDTTLTDIDIDIDIKSVTERFKERLENGELADLVRNGGSCGPPRLVSYLNLIDTHTSE